jgi:hypothetical protein
MAVVLAVLLGTLGTQAIAFSDYEVEAEPAAVALAAGHLGRFVALAPAYGGSLLLSAPFGWAASVLGVGTDLGLYRALVLPALLGSAALGVALWHRRRAVGGRGAALALTLAVANPLSLRALEVGHPEEIVGGVLCVAAVLLALRDRAVAAGVLLGLAGANKPWALLAVAPVLLALQAGRWRCALTAGGVCAALLTPLVLGGSMASSTAAMATNENPIFQPWQVFWFFGDHGAPVMGALGEKVGFRSVVGWAQTVSHPAVVVVGIALGMAGVSRRRRDGALALLALVFLTRCALDTWNTVYYVVPFVFALLSHEVVARRRAPVGTLVTTVALWVAFELVHPPDVQAALFLLIAATAWTGLALAAFAPERAAALTRVGRARAARALPTLLPDRNPHLHPETSGIGGAWTDFAQAPAITGR